MYSNQGLGPSNTQKFSKKTRGPRQFVDSIIPSPTDSISLATDPQYTSTDSSDTGTSPTDLGHASTDFILSPAAYGYLATDYGYTSNFGYQLSPIQHYQFIIEHYKSESSKINSKRKSTEYQQGLKAKELSLMQINLTKLKNKLDKTLSKKTTMIIEGNQIKDQFLKLNDESFEEMEKTISDLNKTILHHKVTQSELISKSRSIKANMKKLVADEVSKREKEITELTPDTSSNEIDEVRRAIQEELKIKDELDREEIAYKKMVAEASLYQKESLYKLRLLNNEIFKIQAEQSKMAFLEMDQETLESILLNTSIKDLRYALNWRLGHIEYHNKQYVKAFNHFSSALAGNKEQYQLDASMLADLKRILGLNISNKKLLMLAGQALSEKKLDEAIMYATKVTVNLSCNLTDSATAYMLLARVYITKEDWLSVDIAQTALVDLSTKISKPMSLLQEVNSIVREIVEIITRAHAKYLTINNQVSHFRLCVLITTNVYKNSCYTREQNIEEIISECRMGSYLRIINSISTSKPMPNFKGLATLELMNIHADADILPHMNAHLEIFESDSGINSILHAWACILIARFKANNGDIPSAQRHYHVAMMNCQSLTEALFELKKIQKEQDMFSSSYSQLFFQPEPPKSTGLVTLKSAAVEFKS